MPYELTIVQPFTTTSDPTMLSIKPTPNINEKTKAMLNNRAETIDIEGIAFEDADLEGETLPHKTKEIGNFAYKTNCVPINKSEGKNINK